MTMDGQLSFIETEKDAQDLDVKHNALPVSQNTQEPSSDNAHSFGKQTYADLKGRPSISESVCPEKRNVAKPANKQAPVPNGYTAPSTEEEKYLSVKEVALRYSNSVPTIWRWSKEVEAFPKPHIIRPGTSRWRMSDLLAFENRNLEA
ncbi:hypothetical protein JAU75_19175 [Ochrobactrum sp. Q0168]|uniref:helix-turn-helix transcriptional regulator n=1 Tax=Ochrobactrum sp. Q0168 TaxID=2793241 RepID=UPI0018ED43AD|nr:hypothetical protein [Ochrobactrum sp. Q0168]